MNKIYISNYNDYIDINNYIKNTEFKCSNGTIIKLSDYLFPIFVKSNFDKEISLIFTPMEVDYFLIKYCPLKIIQKAMCNKYDKQFIQNIKHNKSEFDLFIKSQSGQHIKFITKPRFKNCKYGYVINIYNMKYSKKDDIWISDYELGNWDSYYANTNCKSIKALIRKIKSWDLPINSICEIFTRSERKNFLIKITK